MSRLLFAAARGARIQARAQTADGDTWYGAAGIVLKKDLRTLRIHPADAALEYGPVSSALRKTAEDGKFADLPKVCGCEMMLWVVDSGPEWDSATKIHRRMFLLFLAEALADEGL